MSFLFSDYGIRNIKYLDLGTNIPNFGNNTYAFYKRGSTGVCVEADASLIENIKKIRSRDKVINAGVAPENGEADFYVFNEPAISTFDKEEAEFREGPVSYTHLDVYKRQKLHSAVFAKAITYNIPCL